MSEYTYSAAGLKNLKAKHTSLDSTHQEQEPDLLEVVSVSETLPICYFCNEAIKPEEPINLHHPLYKSKGGTQVEPAHKQCHIEHHSRQGDFREWGKRSSQTYRWAFNLNNVSTHPAYESHRQFYLMNYAFAGWAEGL